MLERICHHPATDCEQTYRDTNRHRDEQWSWQTPTTQRQNCGSRRRPRQMKRQRETGNVFVRAGHLGMGNFDGPALSRRRSGLCVCSGHELLPESLERRPIAYNH